MSLYRVPVEYIKQETALYPYLLGLWLGDGHTHGAAFTNSDPEIITYLQESAKTNGINLKSKVIKNKIGSSIFHAFSSETRKKGSNFLLKGLQDFNLLRNKHIPKEYLFNNRASRLELLAGLLDTDGNLNLNPKSKLPTNYEITQKIKVLAEQIQELASGLGFYASLNKKIATMKRDDGTIYRCPVYRVNIYGDLYKIPCKVKRRIAHKFPYHKNRRDPLKTGFELKYRGNDNYYGFTLDGNHLFCLGD